MFISTNIRVRSTLVLFVLFFNLNTKATALKEGLHIDQIRKNLCHNYIEVNENAVRNSFYEVRENENALRVYRQLWNLYYLRNESKLTNPQERREVEELMNMSRPPCLHAGMPVQTVHKEILNTATSLLIRLSKEIRTAQDDEARDRAQANFDYLAKNYLPRLKNGWSTSTITPYEVKRLAAPNNLDVAQ